MMVEKKTYLNLIKENSGTVLFLFAMVALTIYAWRIGYIVWEDNDDALASFVTFGFFGKAYSGYTIYRNVVLGKIAAGIHTLFPQYNALVLSYFIGMLVGFTLLQRVFSENLGIVIGTFMTSLIYLISFPTLYHGISFTKFAGLLGICGLVGLTDAIRKRGKIFRIIFGLILVAFGCMLRISAFALTVPFWILILGRILYYDHSREMIKKTVMTVGSVALVVVLLAMTDRVVCGRGTWGEFSRYNSLRTELLDYGMPPVYTNEEAYRELGWSETDWQMFRSWHYADTTWFSAEKLENTVAFKESYTKDHHTLRQYLVQFEDNYVQNRRFIMTLLLLVVFFSFFGTADLFMGGICVLMLAELAYYFYIGRWFERVIFIPLICTMVLTVYAMDAAAVKASSRRARIAVLAVLSFYAVINCGILTAEKTEADPGRKAQLEAFFITLQNHPENLYVMDTSDDAWTETFAPFEGSTLGSVDNLILDSGWLVPSPIFDKTAGYSGTPDVYRMLVENDNVYLVGDLFLDLKLRYVREHYGEEIEVVQADDYWGIPIYRFVRP